jgi:hypothetical protein
MQITMGGGYARKTEEATVSINGHMIRPVRTGDRMLFTVDGTGKRFTTQDAAELYAAMFLDPKHRRPLRNVCCDVCGNYGDDCTGDVA